MKISYNLYSCINLRNARRRVYNKNGILKFHNLLKNQIDLEYGYIPRYIETFMDNHKRDNSLINAYNENYIRGITSYCRNDDAIDLSYNMNCSYRKGHPNQYKEIGYYMTRARQNYHYLAEKS